MPGRDREPLDDVVQARLLLGRDLARAGSRRARVGRRRSTTPSDRTIASATPNAITSPSGPYPKTRARSRTRPRRAARSPRAIRSHGLALVRRDLLVHGLPGELDLDRPADRVLDVEELRVSRTRRSSRRRSRGTTWIARVQQHHLVVVELPRVGDLRLGAGELLLQGQEVLVRLQVGVVLGDGEQLTDPRGDLRSRPAPGPRTAGRLDRPRRGPRSRARTARARASRSPARSRPGSGSGRSGAGAGRRSATSRCSRGRGARRGGCRRDASRRRRTATHGDDDPDGHGPMVATAVAPRPPARRAASIRPATTAQSKDARAVPPRRGQGRRRAPDRRARGRRPRRGRSGSRGGTSSPSTPSRTTSS